MTSNPEKEKYIVYGSIGTLILFLMLQFFGKGLFENNWSFTHLQSSPSWYIALPIVVCLLLFFILYKNFKFLETLLENKKSQLGLFLFFILIFIVFQFDGFVYGGGNYKINQIAQVDNIIYRFYEFSTILIVSLFFKILSLFSIDSNSAGVISWKIQTYIAVALVFVSSIILAKKITQEKQNRFLVFLILFFGPQALTYFGFVGNTTLITACMYFFVYVVLKIEKEISAKNILLLWTVQLLAVTVHISLLLLVPVFIFVTFYALTKKSKISFFVGLLSYIILVIAVYSIASSHFLFTKYILFLEHLNMHIKYDLFSSQHISDFLQLLFLFVPQIILLLILFFIHIKNTFTTFSLQLALLLSISSLTLLFIMEPTHSVILDAPLYTAYLSPLLILLVLYIAQKRNALIGIAVVTLFIPICVLPTYTQIPNAEKHIAEYLKKNQQFYIEGSTAIQDSYFYMKEIDKANYWYINLPKLSRDFLDYTAGGEYTYARMYPEATKLYYQLKSKYPYWGDIRAQLASIFISQKKFNFARAELDTCLMLNPYSKSFLKLNYTYDREMGNFLQTKGNILKALEIFPNDYDIQTDLAVAYYRLGQMQQADSVATFVLQNDTTQAFALLIRGFIAEINKDPQSAIKYMQQFIKLAPDEPETPQIRKRLNELILQQRSD